MKLHNYMFLLSFIQVITFMCSTHMATAAVKKNPLKVYLLVGQSNMVGHGMIKGEDRIGTLEYCIAHGDKNKYAFLTDRKGKIVEQDDVWIYYENKEGKKLSGNLTTGYALNSESVGLELSFGEQIQKQEGQQVLLIKTAWGGKSLAKDFRPPSSGGKTGKYYHETVRITKEVLRNLKQYFPDYNEKAGYEIAGLAWHQGWNDHVSKPFTAQYTKNLAHLIKDLRKEFLTDFPVVIATTGMAIKRDAIAGDNEKYKPIEKAQLALADIKRFPEFKGNVILLDTKPFWRDIKKSPVPSGGQHYHWNKSAESYLDIGFAMAEAFAKFKTRTSFEK